MPVDPSRYRCKTYSDDISVLTVTYGNTELADYMAKSLFKQLGYPVPVIVMNNKEMHVPSHNAEFFTEVDNSGGRLTATTDEMRTLARKASNKHAMAVSYGLENLVKTRWCLLCDDDVLFKPTIRYLLESPCTSNLICEVGCDKVRINRVFPYMCIIDMDKMRSDGIRYFDPARCDGTVPSIDTGTSFLQDVRGHWWNVEYVYIRHFIEHMKGATLHDLDWKKWISDNEILWKR